MEFSLKCIQLGKKAGEEEERTTHARTYPQNQPCGVFISRLCTIFLKAPARMMNLPMLSFSLYTTLLSLATNFLTLCIYYDPTWANDHTHIFHFCSCRSQLSVSCYLTNIYMCTYTYMYMYMFAQKLGIFSSWQVVQYALEII